MKPEIPKTFAYISYDPIECPFREFRDQELGIEYWGMGPTAFRNALINKSTTKQSADYIWVDDQAQPLPRSVRKYLHGWVRAEELAASRWDAEIVVFEDTGTGKMSIMDMQLSHAQVLLRSSFCRKVLSLCYILEKAEITTVEHTWEGFSFALGPEGWRARYHIYSPGMKSGGGPQHRPTISKNGCYLVRLYYMGSWRCVWVSDQVPVDATDAPLLPFCPLISHVNSPLKPSKIPELVQSGVVHLWPLLVCKALLKLCAHDMTADPEYDAPETHVEDEIMSETNIFHALTGGMIIKYPIISRENLWSLLQSEVQMYSWDDDDETIASTIKTKSTKQKANKDTVTIKRSLVYGLLCDTREEPPYLLPGITPAHEMPLYISVIRDVPVKKPLPEPDVALWKTYRWVDWARSHGLYDAYECPKTKYLKVTGLLKLSGAPHLLDVHSTESITFCFKEEHQTEKKKNTKDQSKSTTTLQMLQMREELREWVLFKSIFPLFETTEILFFPSTYQFASTCDNPPMRMSSKAPVNKLIDVQAPKQTPVYLQVDSPEENRLKISLTAIHPRILMNSGLPVEDYLEPGYFVLEVFEWFKDLEVPKAKAYVQTREYDSVEITMLPGRHFCRIWVHSRMHWHLAVLSDSTLLIGSRDLIQCAAVHECPWVARFLYNLGAAFNNWIRTGRSVLRMTNHDKEFYKAYEPDLNWDPVLVGYKQKYVHWMFRQALQAHLTKRLGTHEFQSVCFILRKYFLDPEFGFSPKPKPGNSVRGLADRDPCDCLLPEEVLMEEVQEEQQNLQVSEHTKEEEVPVVSSKTMATLLQKPKPPVQSQICEFATEEVPCGVLKREREKVIRKHEAATMIQARWRGAWARKILLEPINPTSEMMKMLLDSVSHIEALGALMNEFFSLYPGTRSAYSAASALGGVYGLAQHAGAAPITTKCKWIPYFQGIFNCHEPVKVHFDLHSALPYSTVVIYNNDSSVQLPQAYNAHITFDITPNIHGYTVIGHGTVNQPVPTSSEINWQLTILSSHDHVFHICDNDPEMCNILPLNPSSKLRLEEIYIPNRRKIIGGIVISVVKNDAVSFRATTTTPELEIEAVLRTVNENGAMEEIARCSGKGEICWTYIQLKAFPVGQQVVRKKSASHANLYGVSKETSSARTPPIKKKSTAAAGVKAKSATKLKETKAAATIEVKQYVIEVVARNGWPLGLEQWERVDIIRNSLEPPKVEAAKKTGKEKSGSAKDKKDPETKAPVSVIHVPMLGDAYTVLECAISLNGGATARREDDRDVAFAAARQSWEANEPGRNLKGAAIRKEFRDKYLVPERVIPPHKSETVISFEELPDDCISGVNTSGEPVTKPSPSLVTSDVMEESVEEEAKYLHMPDQLRDRFIPFTFLESCIKEKSYEEPVILTFEIAEAGKKERHARIEDALERMKDLQHFNNIHVLDRQRRRYKLLENIGIDAQFSPEIHQVLGERDEAIAQEALERSLSATRKKQEAKTVKGK